MHGALFSEIGQILSKSPIKSHSDFEKVLNLYGEHIDKCGHDNKTVFCCERCL